MKKKSKYASGGSVGSHRADPRPMSLADRIKESRARTSAAIGDAPAPKPAPRPQKPKPYAEGGMVATGMPAPQPRPSDFRVGPLQFGGPGGMGGYGGAGSPVGAPGMPPAGPMPGGGRPMRDQRGMEDMKNAMKDRLGGLSGRFAGMGGRMRPNAPAPVGPGGGYKKGGKIDGCAMRGMTKGKNK